LADRIASLRAGRIELTGTTHEVAVRAGLATRISITTPSALLRGQVPPPHGIELSVRGPESVCHTGNAAMTLRLLLDWARQISLPGTDIKRTAVFVPGILGLSACSSGSGPRHCRPGRISAACW
jgi:hypothetical protein